MGMLLHGGHARIVLHSAISMPIRLSCLSYHVLQGQDGRAGKQGKVS